MTLTETCFEFVDFGKDFYIPLDGAFMIKFTKCKHNKAFSKEFNGTDHFEDLSKVWIEIH